MGKFEPGREADHVVFEFEDADGGVTRTEMTLEEAAALQRGETVAGFGLTDYFSLADRIAAAQADLDQIAERKAEMRREFPGLEHGEWSE